MAQPPLRIGHGYDIHRLVSGRKLMLGGIPIPHSKGLEGHSDADCLIHALADAILGALALPDIGHYFPNQDPTFKNMESRWILVKAVEEAQRLGFLINNVDISLIAEEPKIGPYLPQMRTQLAQLLKISENAVGLKATTNEGMDAIGNGEAIAAHAVVLLIGLPS